MEPQHLESLYPAATREKEISEIFEFIKQGKSCQLIGLPGAGRANILGFLAYNRDIRTHHTTAKGQFQYHFVLINFSEVRNRPLFDVMKYIFLELSSSLHERKREEEFIFVDKLFKEVLSYQDELVLFQGLKDAVDFLTLEKNLTLTFLFERFETYIPQISADFFNNLRSMKTRAQYKFAVVFSTTRPLEDMLEPDILADFHEFVVDNYVYVCLQDTVEIKFRISYLEKLTKKKLSQETINSVIQQTAGHSKLTRLSFEAILAKDITKGKVAETLLPSLKTIQSSLKEIWLFLTPDEQQDVLIHQNNMFLQDIGLLYQDKVTIPLFQKYIQETSSLQKEISPFTLDLATGTIRHGDVVISDILTRSEFRLLRLLLEHTGEIVEREDIIRAVWSETKTQEGVSEQALDQLILRLRKKIEADPNNPTYIQTIKGRGVKFVQ